MAGRGRARPGAELGGLQGVRSLGLQPNRIEKIENLGCFPNLRPAHHLARAAAPTPAVPVLRRFLSLAGNRIREVENLRPLQHLRFLDLSQNQIQMLDPDELPRSLQLLDLTGNTCTRQPRYRELVVGALPHLLQLDTRPLRGCTDPAPGEEEEEEGSSSSEDDEELFPEPSAPFTADKGARAEAGHGLCGGQASQSPCPQGWQQGQGALVAVPGPAVILPPPGQISLQTFTGSWPGAPGGGRGRPWRNTGAACRGCGGCCCPPRRAQRAPRPAEPPAPGRGSGPRPQAGSAPSPREAGAVAMSPPGRAGRPPHPQPAPAGASPAARPCEGRQAAKEQRNRQHPKDPAQHQSGLKPLYSYKSLSAAGSYRGAGQGQPRSPSPSPPSRPWPSLRALVLLGHVTGLGALRPRQGWRCRSSRSPPSRQHGEAAPKREEARNRGRAPGRFSHPPDGSDAMGGAELEPGLSSSALPTHLHRVYL
ncbi:leucine-rich repeat-containing protein 46 isoform X3 [Anser cygnoides]|uniref:leucine-rich repeat-containing protein 46 isoform X3 n=1 Tax=Anser cygnoides TaxID=8845 RepID=UPI0034D1716A